MNSFIKNNKQFFSLVLGLLLSSSLAAVTINNEPLTNFIQTGNVLVATFSEKDTYIVLEMESDNLNVRCHDIDGLSGLEKVFQQVMDNSSCLFNSKGSLTLSSNVMNNNLSYMIGGESIKLQVKKITRFC